MVSLKWKQLYAGNTSEVSTARGQILQEGRITTTSVPPRKTRRIQQEQ